MATLGLATAVGREIEQQRLQGLPAPHYEIIGVVGDTPDTIEVAAARAGFGRLDPDLAVDRIGTLRDLLGESASGHESNLLPFGCFARSGVAAGRLRPVERGLVHRE